MDKLKDKFKSIRVKLFLTLCIAVTIIIVFLILTNNFVLETFYLYSKQQNLIEVCNTINDYYTNGNNNIDIELELEKIAINNNFDILIRTNKNISIYSSNKDFILAINEINTINAILQKDRNIVYEDEKISIRRVADKRKWTYIYIM